MEPQWFFCAQTIKKSHCAAGMVFSLNAGGADGEFLQNARNQSQAGIASTISAFEPFPHISSFKASMKPTHLSANSSSTIQPLTETEAISSILLITAKPSTSAGCTCVQPTSASSIFNSSLSTSTRVRGGQSPSLTASPIISNNSWKIGQVFSHWRVLMSSVVIFCIVK